jgi:DNA-binding HxlR family transcriptional regulator
MRNQRKLKDYNPYGCPIIHFMEMIGGKWKIIIFYAISINVKRFSKLKKAIPAISKQTLVNALRELEDDGLITRTVFPETPPHIEYELTDQTKSMMPVIMMMEQWGLKDLERLNIQEKCNFKSIGELIA